MKIKYMTKYLFLDSIKTLASFYAIYIAIQVFLNVIFASTEATTMQVASLSTATMILLFVAFLNSLKAPVRFAVANGISRKTYFYSNLINIAVISGIVTFVEIILTQLLGTLGLENSSYYLILYVKRYPEFIGNVQGILESFIWTCLFYSVWCSFGLLVTSVYYRSNKIMKVIVSIVPPALLFSLLAYSPVTAATATPLMQQINRFFLFLIGYNTSNPYPMITAFLILTLIFICGTYLLIRRAPIKE